MEWKRKKQGDGKFTTIASGRSLKYEISSIGGFITVKRYFLDVTASYEKNPSMSLTFYSLQAAKDFGNNIEEGKPVVISPINIGSGYL